MAHQEILLKLAGLSRVDEGRGKVTEPGGHAIHDLSGIDECVDDVACLLHPAARIVVEGDGGPVSRDRLDVFDRQIRPRQDDEASATAS
jgi:hypothetical protein